MEEKIDFLVAFVRTFTLSIPVSLIFTAGTYVLNLLVFKMISIDLMLLSALVSFFAFFWIRFRTVLSAYDDRKKIKAKK